MPSDLPVVLITGAARRVGAAIARHFHGLGYNLVVHYRHSADAAHALQAELHLIRPASVLLIQADLSPVNQVAPLVYRVQEFWGRLDVLINNASAFYPTPIGKAREQDWEELLGSNLRAPFFLSQAAAPLLREQKGSIINIVDIYAERPLKNHTLYCMAKAGLVMMTKSLARELGPDIRVNGVAPGAVLWPDSGQDELARQRIISQSALKKAGAPEDIAEAIEFLVTRAEYITGHILTVDGGRSLSLS